jgi:hypothetical protein
MSTRKTPVLLRRGPMSGIVQAITNYRSSKEGYIKVVGDGKHDVQSDFDTLLLEELIPDPQSTIMAELDGAARGMKLNEHERQIIAEFRKRLVTVIERHNARLP